MVQAGQGVQSSGQSRQGRSPWGRTECTLTRADFAALHCPRKDSCRARAAEPTPRYKVNRQSLAIGTRCTSPSALWTRVTNSNSTTASRESKVDLRQGPEPNEQSSCPQWRQKAPNGNPREARGPLPTVGGRAAQQASTMRRRPPAKYWSPMDGV